MQQTLVYCKSNSISARCGQSSGVQYCGGFLVRKPMAPRPQGGLSRRPIGFVHVSPGFVTFSICHTRGFVARFVSVNIQISLACMQSVMCSVQCPIIVWSVYFSLCSVHCAVCIQWADMVTQTILFLYLTSGQDTWHG